MQHAASITYEFWVYSEDNGYIISSKTNNSKIDLISDLWHNYEDYGPYMYCDLKDNIVSISQSSSFDILKPAPIIFENDNDRQLFEQAYEKYSAKFYSELACLTLTIQNYEYVMQVFYQIKVIKPKYIMWYLKTVNNIDIVQVLFKDTISDKETKILAQQQKEYDQWQKAYDLAKKDRYVGHMYWWAEESALYASDIAQYYDRDIGFIVKPVYTREQLGALLLDQVQKRVPVALIGYWAYRINDYHNWEKDKICEEIFFILSTLSYGHDYQAYFQNNDQVTYFTLEKIACKLLGKKDFIISDIFPDKDVA